MKLRIVFHRHGKSTPVGMDFIGASPSDCRAFPYLNLAFSTVGFPADLLRLECDVTFDKVAKTAYNRETMKVEEMTVLVVSSFEVDETSIVKNEAMIAEALETEKRNEAREKYIAENPYTKYNGIGTNGGNRYYA